MANKGAKKQKEENEKHLKMLQKVIMGANAVYILVRLSLRFSTFTWRHWVGLIFTTAVYKFSFDQIKAMAQPTYDEKGELIDGGYDLKQGGLSGYIHDIVYITAFVQVASVISDRFWYFYLVVPAFGLYKLWQHVLYPYFFQKAPEESEEDDKTKKKREKMERRASRAPMVRGSRGR